MELSSPEILQSLLANESLSLLCDPICLFTATTVPPLFNIPDIKIFLNLKSMKDKMLLSFLRIHRSSGEPWMNEEYSGRKRGQRSCLKTGWLAQEAKPIEPLKAGY